MRAAAAARAAGTGTAWLRAGGRMYTITAVELARLAELSAAAVDEDLVVHLDELVDAVRRDRAQLAPVVGSAVAESFPVALTHAQHHVGELRLAELEQLAALARLVAPRR